MSKKRILLLSDINSEHTEKWALGLAAAGFEVGLFSFNRASVPWYQGVAGITDLNPMKTAAGSRTVLSKLGYLRYLPKLKKAIAAFQPDILHAHYATSYGLLGAASGFHPFFISTWGTDVMKFPDKNFLYRGLVKRNLLKADLVLATSNAIVEFVHRIARVDVKVIPFGVDMQKFMPASSASPFGNDTLVISCIKSMEKIYCIDVLLEAFRIVKERNSNVRLKLLLVGEGSQKAQLENTALSLGISADTLFTGRIDFAKIASYHNMSDIVVNISEYESFGVSVIEALACEKPVVVTNVGGLKEIVQDGSNGLLVPVRDVKATAAAIEKLVRDKELRVMLGRNGREKVGKLYNWTNNLQEMADVYHKFIKR